MEHEAIRTAYFDDENGPDLRPGMGDYVNAFIHDTGAIRVHGSPYGTLIDVQIDTSTGKPTPAQWEAIRRGFHQVEKVGAKEGKPIGLGYDINTYYANDEPENRPPQVARYIEKADENDLYQLEMEVERLG